MAPEPTNTTPPARDERPERPEWARRVLEALQDALCFGGGDGERLTAAERDLLDVVCLRVRHRLGESGPDGPDGLGLDTLADFLFERGTKAIAAEQGRS
jgi:hypothetical protein